MNQTLCFDNHADPARPLHVSAGTDALTFKVGGVSPASAVVVLDWKDAARLCAMIGDNLTRDDTPDYGQWTPIMAEPTGVPINDAVLCAVADMANEQHWTKNELADRAHMDRELAIRLFEGNAGVTIDDIDRFADALGVPFFTLVDRCMDEYYGSGVQA